MYNFLRLNCEFLNFHFRHVTRVCVYTVIILCVLLTCFLFLVIISGCFFSTHCDRSLCYTDTEAILLLRLFGMMSGD